MLNSGLPISDFAPSCLGSASLLLAVAYLLPAVSYSTTKLRLHLARQIDETPSVKVEGSRSQPSL